MISLEEAKAHFGSYLSKDAKTIADYEEWVRRYYIWRNAEAQPVVTGFNRKQRRAAASRARKVR